MSPAVWAKAKPANHSRSSPRPSGDGPQQSSAEEPDAAVLILLMPEKRALWDNTSTMSDSDEKAALRKQLCRFA